LHVAWITWPAWHGILGNRHANKIQVNSKENSQKAMACLDTY